MPDAEHKTHEGKRMRQVFGVYSIVLTRHGQPQGVQCGEFFDEHHDAHMQSIALRIQWGSGTFKVIPRMYLLH